LGTVGFWNYLHGVGCQFNIKALLKKPISELTPAELRRRLEYAEAQAAYLKKLEALAQSKATKENKPK
jgi:transposase